MYSAQQLRDLIECHACIVADTDVALRMLALLIDDPRNTGPGFRAAIVQQLQLAVGTHVASKIVQRIVVDVVNRFALNDRIVQEWCETQGLTALQDRYPWPAFPVSDLAERNDRHFTGAGLNLLLSETLKLYSPQLVVEVGCWLGGSTRRITELSSATVICVDTWLGSEEHQAGRAWQERDGGHGQLLNRLFDQFVVNCFDLKDQVVPMRTTSVFALYQLAALNLCPDLIILDGAHDRFSVATELELCRRFFPHARIIVDDYNAAEPWLSGLVTAVNDFAASNRQEVIVAEGAACLLASW